MSPEPRPQTERRALMVGLFGWTLTGLPAIVVLMTIAALIVLLAVYLRPSLSSPLWISGVGWLLFIGYWSAAARHTARTVAAESPRSRQVHQLMLYGSLLLAFVRLPGTAARWLPLSIVMVIAGLAVQFAALALAVWARRHLGRQWSAEITAKEAHQLVQDGPYRRIRHPIYTAMIGMVVGTALVSGEVHGLIAIAVILIAYMRKIRLEEQHLATVFGAAYEEYRRRSWALIPGIV